MQWRAVEKLDFGNLFLKKQKRLWKLYFILLSIDLENLHLKMDKGWSSAQDTRPKQVLLKIPL